MNFSQYTELNVTKKDVALISINDLSDRRPRTLIYGYTSGRETFHVYIGEDDCIHRMVSLYVPGGEVLAITAYGSGESGGVESNHDFAPQKRIYPESSDFEFCMLLKRAGVNLSFTPIDESSDVARAKKHGTFRGEIMRSDAVMYVNAKSILPEEARGFPELADEAARQLGVKVLANMNEENFIPKFEAKPIASLVSAMLQDAMVAESISEPVPFNIGESLLEDCFGYEISEQFNTRQTKNEGGTIVLNCIADKFSSEKPLCESVKNSDFVFAAPVTDETKIVALIDSTDVGWHKHAAIVFDRAYPAHITIFIHRFGTEEVFISRINDRLKTDKIAAIPKAANKLMPS